MIFGRRWGSGRQGGEGLGEGFAPPRPLLEVVCARLGISDRQAGSRDGFGIE